MADQATGKLAVNEGIHSIAQKLNAAPPEQKAAMIQKLAENPAIFKMVLNHLTGKTEDLEPSDESIEALKIENGARAKFIQEQAFALPAEKRGAFLTHLAEKKLLNSRVMEQLTAGAK